MTAKRQTFAHRPLDERRRAALDLLGSNFQLWLTTARDGHGAHLIPVAYVWDGTCLTMATLDRCRTSANLRANPRARVAIGEPSDLVMIDGEATLISPAAMDPVTAESYARVSFDPRELPGLTYLRLVPTQMQVWNGFHEFHGRTVMANGEWLDEPLDPPAVLPDWLSAG